MTVSVKETYFARPAKPAPNSPLILSNYDLMMMPVYASYIYFFKNVNNEDKFMDADKLFSSLEDILSDYYPLAGQLREEPEGRMSIVSSDRGVPFIVAESPDITIKHLEEKNWDSSLNTDGLLPIHNILAYSIDAPLFAVKHTTLVDGVALAVAANHLATDGNGFFSFVINWGRKARKEPFIPPVNDRSLLKASGNPPTQEHNTEFVVNDPLSNFTTMNNNLKLTSTIIRKMVYFSKNDLRKIHDVYSSKNPSDSRISINDALTAHIWRTVTRARGIPLDEQVACVFPRDIRGILNPPLPPSYFGNAVINLYPRMTVSELIKGPRSKIALHIRNAHTEVDESKIRSSIDWIEQHPKKYNVKPNSFSSNDLVFTNLITFQVNNLDLGYGNPVRCRLRRDITFGGTVIILRAPNGDGFEVCISLPDEHIQKLEQDPEFRMFQPLAKL